MNVEFRIKRMNIKKESQHKNAGLHIIIKPGKNYTNTIFNSKEAKGSFPSAESELKLTQTPMSSCPADNSPYMKCIDELLIFISVF